MVDVEIAGISKRTEPVLAIVVGLIHHRGVACLRLVVGEVRHRRVIVLEVATLLVVRDIRCDVIGGGQRASQRAVIHSLSLQFVWHLLSASVPVGGPLLRSLPQRCMVARELVGGAIIFRGLVDDADVACALEVLGRAGHIVARLGVVDAVVSVGERHVR